MTVRNPRGMKCSKGLTLIEVIVAMLILAIVGVGLLGMLPMLTKNTVGASVDTRESQQAISIFEKIATDWSNVTAWTNDTVNTGATPPPTVEQFVVAKMAEIGASCRATVTLLPSVPIRRVVITCDASGNLPARELRAEFGNPND